MSTEDEVTLEECPQCGAMVPWDWDGRVSRMSRRHSSWHRDVSDQLARSRWAFTLSSLAVGFALGIFFLIVARGG